MHKYVLVPKQFSDIMWSIGRWYAKTYPLEVVPEYSITAYAKLGGLPSFLRFKDDKYSQYLEEAVFYYPYAWVTLQVVLANVVVYSSILKEDIPPRTEADGVGLVHRHPLPGMCSPEDCTFAGSDSPIVSNVVWSDAYAFNSNFVCGCTLDSPEDGTQVVVYDVSELECTLPECTGGKVPDEWYMQTLSDIQLSKIIVMPDLGKEYIKKLFGLNSLQRVRRV